MKNCILSMTLVCVTACSSSTPIDRERSEWRGAYTKLTLLDIDPPLGQPLRIRLELFNQGIEALAYDDQGVYMDSIEVMTADGKKVPYIGWIAQTFVHLNNLDPGKEAELLEDRDLSADFLFEKAGHYRIRFGGGGLYFPKSDDNFSRFPISLISNWVDVTIGVGRVPSVVEIFKKLRFVLPREWEIATGTGGHQVTVRLLRTQPWIVEDELWLRIGGEPSQGEVRLGESRWGVVWIRRRSKVEGEILPRIAEALIRS